MPGLSYAYSPAEKGHALRYEFPAHIWQERAFRSKQRNIALIAGRRGGKSVWLSVEGLHLCLAPPVGTVVLTGPDLPTIKQSVLHIMLSADLGGWPREVIVNHNRNEGVIELPGGNRLLYRGGHDPDDLRGIKAKAVLIEEITLCKPDILPIVEACTLDTKGCIRAVGTPKGRNWLWELLFNREDTVEAVPGHVWKSGLWEIIRYSSLENPAIDPVELARIGADYDERMRRQEFEAEFVSWAGSAFDADALSRCFAAPLGHWGVALPDHPTVIGIDVAGYGRDWTVALVLCWKCRAVVDVFRSHRLPFQVVYSEVGKLAARWKPREVIYDYTSLGGQTTGDEFASTVSKISPGTHCTPFTFTKKDKADLLMALSARLEEVIGIPSRPELQALRNQLRSYQWDDKDLSTDDVMALALAAKGMPAKGVGATALPRGANLAPEPYKAIDWAHAFPEG